MTYLLCTEHEIIRALFDLLLDLLKLNRHKVLEEKNHILTQTKEEILTQRDEIDEKKSPDFIQMNSLSNRNIQT